MGTADRGGSAAQTDPETSVAHAGMVLNGGVSTQEDGEVQSETDA